MNLIDTYKSQALQLLLPGTLVLVEDLGMLPVTNSFEP